MSGLVESGQSAVVTNELLEDRMPKTTEPNKPPAPGAHTEAHAAGHAGSAAEPRGADGEPGGVQRAEAEGAGQASEDFVSPVSQAWKVRPMSPKLPRDNRARLRV